jgi:amino acid transporter
VGAAVALADGMVWSELAAAFPGSGGTYHFYDAAYGESRVGRLLKFVFVWQFLFSGPLEVATGAIGMAKYLGYFYPRLGAAAWDWAEIVPNLDAEVTWGQVSAMGVMVLVTALAYRRIAVAGRLMVALWVGMLITVGWVVATGLSHFDTARAFDFSSQARQLDGIEAAGLGMALAIAMYNFLGYYQVCYLGDEVADASRTIPRSILISVAVIGLLYLIMNVGILGALPLQKVVASKHIASDLMLQVYGPWAAGLITALIIWTAVASTFAALLGYSRIPYASARAGHFFKAFAATHPTGHFPHRSLLLLSGLAAVACLADLETVITALLASRILIQFVGQIVTVVYLRVKQKTAPSTYRMPWFPLPALVALCGWMYVFSTSKQSVVIYGVGSLLAGVIVFVVWDSSFRSSQISGDHEVNGSLASGPDRE